MSIFSKSFICLRNLLKKIEQWNECVSGEYLKIRARENIAIIYHLCASLSKMNSFYSLRKKKSIVVLIAGGRILIKLMERNYAMNEKIS